MCIRDRNKEGQSVGIDILISERDSLQRSNAQAAESISKGHEILGSLKAQKDALNRIKRRVKNILDELGLSNTLTTLISKRSRHDTILLLILFISTVVLIFLLYYFVSPWLKSKVRIR
eukprot:TRINITY_DN2629_c0_g1_i5.p1 TRINITY_DN2629_c0_g1~~TRINITY_DN2629_c0_g1_i5.p1  ORF type:complete len:118 (-),score=31.17 TRINITY_DN2629_c0_g1_i5:125-478(-)